ncbi:MAG: penicillin-binding protein 2 [bacterium]|nr:penicillin-binding protein 2 [bacterium]
MSSWRLRALQIFFVILTLGIVARLFYWQIISGSKLQALAESQRTSSIEIPTTRGDILASDGFPMATNQEGYLVSATLPQLNLDKNEIAARLAPILNPSDTDNEKEDLKSKLNRDSVWVVLAHKVDKKTKDTLAALKIAGINFDEEQKRLYPEASMSAHMLGFVGQDNNGHDKGYFGLEGNYDRILAGKAGILKQEKDASGKHILIGNSSTEEEINGRVLQTYFNRGLQFILDDNLKKGIEKYQAKAGLAVVMDPKTGAILAMSSFPNYDPSNYAQTDSNLFSNPVISQTFEPGSIFKPLVMSAAINEGAIKPEDKCTKCEGPRQIGEYTIRTWDDKYHPDSTMSDILVHSDNVGMVFVGEKLGQDKLLSYIRNFGIGEMTGIDLEGETTAFFRTDGNWPLIDYATLSFGQGVAVTPIQMARAISAIANGGELLEPHVVSEIKSDSRDLETKVKVQRRVISETTAKVVTEMMVNAVEKGGKWERPKGYRIAGKTGTAQVPIAGHYDKTKTIVSFVGFAPADDPRFVMLITLREPALTWGSMTVAPLWMETAKEIFYYLKIPPKF